MSLPSDEEMCCHAASVLEDVLCNEELRAVAQEAQCAAATSTTARTPLSGLGGGLVVLSRSVLEQAGVLLAQLRPVSGSLPASPNILDSPLFVRRSRFLHERLRRVKVAFRSLKHVGLLSEESAGRRVIIDRAFVSAKELLDTIIAVSSTVAAPQPLASCCLQNRFQRDLEMNKQGESSGIPNGAINKEPDHFGVSTALTDTQNECYSLRKTPLQQTQKRPLKDLSACNIGLSTTDSTTAITSPNKILSTTEKKEEYNDVKERKEGVSMQNENDERVAVQKDSSEINEPRDSSLASLVSRDTTTNISPTSSLAAVDSAGRLSSTIPYFDSGASSGGHHITEMEIGGSADALNKKVVTNHISYERFSDSKVSSTALEHNRLLYNIPVSVYCRNEDDDLLRSTRVSLQRRLFRGQNWKKLLHEESAVISGWKKVFISDIGLLFGVPDEWVLDVHVSDDSSVSALTDGDQEVVFKVRLPLSFENSEIQKRIEQHEFTKLTHLYESLEEDGGQGQEDRVVAGEKEHGLCELSNGNSAGPAQMRSSDEAVFFEFTKGDIKSKNDEGNFDIVDTNKSLHFVKLFSLTIDEESQAREKVQEQEEYGRELLLKTALESQRAIRDCLLNDGVIDISKTKTFLLLQKQSGEQPKTDCDVVGEAVKGLSFAGADDAFPACGLSKPPLPPMVFTSNDTKKEQRLSFLKWSDWPEGETGAAAAAVGVGESVFGINNFLLCSSIPRSFVLKGLGDSPNAAEDSQKLLSTMHKKILSGEGWSNVLYNKEEELRRTFRTEVAALFGIPEKNVRHLEFTLGSLVASFELLHDRYLQEKEINALLTVFDFPMVREIYKQFVVTGANSTTTTTTSAGRFIVDAIEVDRNQKNFVVVSDKSGCLPIPDAPNNSSIGHAECGDGTLASAAFATGPQRTPQKQKLHSSRDLCPTLVRDDSATPDNEPITFAHLALVHDLPVDELVQANPHLAAFGIYDILPPAAHITVPRVALDDYSCCFRDGSDELNSGRATPSAVGSSASRFNTPRDCEGLRSNYLVNLKDLARKLGVTVSALRQRNTHLNSYTDVEPLPKNCSVVVPAHIFASVDSPTLFSSLYSGSPFSPNALTHRDQAFSAVVGASNRGSDRKIPAVPFKMALRDVSSLSQSVDFNEKSGMVAEAVALATVPNNSEAIQLLHQPLELRQLNQDTTQRTFVQPLTNVLSRGEEHRSSLTRSCSAASNVSVRRETAVMLMARSVEQLLLLRFFAKWQYKVIMQKESKLIKSAHDAEIVRYSTNARFLWKRGSCDELQASSSKARGCSQEYNTPMGALSVRSYGRWCGDKPLWTTERRCRSRSGSWGPKTTLESSGRELLPGFLEQKLRHGSVRSRTPTTTGRNKRYEFGHTTYDSFKVPQSEGRHSSQCSSSRSGTPRLNFSRASSSFSGSLANSVDLKSGTGNEASTPNHFLLGLRVSGSLTVTDVCGEAAKAGIRRGDQLQEVEGGRVTTLKGLSRALNCVMGSHVSLSVLEKASGTLRTFTVRRTADVGDRYRSLSRSSSQTEPKITPLLSAARRFGVHSSNTCDNNVTAPRAQPRIYGVPTRLLRGNQGRFKAQMQSQT